MKSLWCLFVSKFKISNHLISLAQKSIWTLIHSWPSQDQTCHCPLSIAVRPGWTCRTMITLGPLILWKYAAFKKLLYGVFSSNMPAICMECSAATCLPFVWSVQQQHACHLYGVFSSNMPTICMDCSAATCLPFVWSVQQQHACHLYGVFSSNMPAICMECTAATCLPFVFSFQLVCDNWHINAAGYVTSGLVRL